MRHKDSRIEAFTNAITNMKFIKIKALENLFHSKIYSKRKEEISDLTKIGVIYSVQTFFNWLNVSICMIGCILWICHFESSTTVAGMSALIRILGNLNGSLSGVPVGIQFYTNLMISVDRINDFLTAREINNEYIEKIEDGGKAGGNVIEMENGKFWWGETAPVAPVQALESDPVKTDNEQFQLEIRDMKVKKGSLTMIIGKVGSGKSSLL